MIQSTVILGRDGQFLLCSMLFGLFNRLREPGQIGKFEIDCGYPFDNVMQNLPKDVLANTQWYFMAYPYIPKELVNCPDFQGLKDFDDIGAAWGGTGGCCGGMAMWFGNEMGWTGENTGNMLGSFR